MPLAFIKQRLVDGDVVLVVGFADSAEDALKEDLILFINATKELNEELWIAEIEVLKRLALS